MEKRISKKFLVIGLVFLCLGASATIGVTAKQGKMDTGYEPVASDRSWSDNFDLYANGQILDGHADDGGWKGWDNVSGAAGVVTNAMSRSSPNSVKIELAADCVHEYEGYTSGQWVYTAWQYIPTDFAGQTYFNLLSDYTDGAGQNNKWAVQIRFDSDLMVAESEYDSVSLPLIEGQWVELRVQIDLTADLFQFYYGDDLLIEKAWTAGPNGVGDGFLDISAVDLFANGASPVYYDDISLVPYTTSLTLDAGGPYASKLGESINFSCAAHGGTPPYTYLWNLGDGNTSTERNPTHTYNAIGLYTVTLNVTDNAQNTIQDTTTANVTGHITKPVLDIEKIKGGFGSISAVIKNTGDGAATNVNWTIKIIGGILKRINKTFTDKIATLAAGANQTIKTKGMIFGLGAIAITISATCDEGASKQVSASGKIFIIYIKI